MGLGLFAVDGGFIPYGGTEPNGTLEETAFFLGAPKLLGGVGQDGLKVFAREGAKLWARFGYTTADEGRATPQTAEVLKQVAALHCGSVMGSNRRGRPASLT